MVVLRCGLDNPLDVAANFPMLRGSRCHVGVRRRYRAPIYLDALNLRAALRQHLAGLSDPGIKIPYMPVRDFAELVHREAADLVAEAGMNLFEDGSGIGGRRPGHHARRAALG